MNSRLCGRAKARSLAVKLRRSHAMRCTLLIPQLFWPRDTAEMAGHGLELPSLAKLLARAQVERFPAISPDAWLCQAFEVEHQSDWPVAPLTLELDGGDPAGAYW